MSVFLVHGVADTHRVFDRVLGFLDRSDVRSLSLPGFGSPVPRGFDGSKEAHVGWIIGEIEATGRAVDLVGHDWGCMLTARVASIRPDLVRTWSGSSGAVAADYVWHDLARLWQTPGAGEHWMDGLDIAAFEQQLIAFGVPAEDAGEAVEHIDGTMKDAILKLYRSGVSAGREWEPDLARIRAPSLILWGLDDPFVPHAFADRLAEGTRAETLVKFRSGHWPLLERPEDFARALTAHWRQFAQ